MTLLQTETVIVWCPVWAKSRAQSRSFSHTKNAWGNCEIWSGNRLVLNRPMLSISSYGNIFCSRYLLFWKHRCSSTHIIMLLYKRMITNMTKIRCLQTSVHNDFRAFREMHKPWSFQSKLHVSYSTSSSSHPQKQLPQEAKPVLWDCPGTGGLRRVLVSLSSRSLYVAVTVLKWGWLVLQRPIDHAACGKQYMLYCCRELFETSRPIEIPLKDLERYQRAKFDEVHTPDVASTLV